MHSAPLKILILTPHYFPNKTIPLWSVSSSWNNSSISLSSALSPSSFAAAFISSKSRVLPQPPHCRVSAWQSESPPRKTSGFTPRLSISLRGIFESNGKSQSDASCASGLKPSAISQSSARTSWSTQLRLQCGMRARTRHARSVKQNGDPFLSLSVLSNTSCSCSIFNTLAFWKSCCTLLLSPASTHLAKHR